MGSRDKFPFRASLYVAVVCVAGITVLATSLPAAFSSPSADWLLLAALALLTGSFTLKVPGLPARISVSETFVFAAVLLYGPAIATVVVALDTLVMSLRARAGKRWTYRTLFNLAACSLSIWTAGQLFSWLAGTDSVATNVALERLLLPLVVLAISYFLLNTWLIAVAMSFERGMSVFEAWSGFLWLILNYIGGASVATLLVSYTQHVNLTALSVIVPILFITYLTFRTSMGRLEDANRHVTQVNELYLSAIETLAMAVDAKDQITHGHIRRVQVYATELAKRLGVTDEQQLKAIEAAALLHDMGKLAIPEYILNKPGKLTPGEFETMKRHSDIGADLLSSIPFPYPVVPIVRHHHENWDGTGYPSRVAGTDIPLGARILGVVDCFDALTSDRPYRPRLSDEAAFEILRERRGTMYDPLVVDTFLESYAAIAPAAILAGQQARTLMVESPTQQERTRALDEIHSGSVESAALVELRTTLARCQAEPELAEVMLSIATRYTPATLLAVYLSTPHDDVLRCVSAANDPDGLMEHFEIPRGERTSGWAAANGATITNSAASLDLGSRAVAFAPPLKAALSTPILGDGVPNGALTAYSTLDAPFTPQHAHFLEQAALILAERLKEIQKGQASLIRFPESSRTTQVRR